MHKTVKRYNQILPMQKISENTIMTMERQNDCKNIAKERYFSERSVLIETAGWKSFRA